MLTEDEMKKIRAEEIYREEIRNLVSKKNLSRFEKVWKVLNSAFGIFVLSSLVVGGLSKLYVSWSNNARQGNENRLTRIQLGVEIEHRLSHLGGLATGKIESAELSGVYLAFHGANVPDWARDGRFQSLFSELKDQTFYGLIWQYSIVVDRKCEKAIRKAAKSAKKMADLVRDTKMHHTTSSEEVFTGTRIYNYYRFPESIEKEYRKQFEHVITWSQSDCGVRG